MISRETIFHSLKDAGLIAVVRARSTEQVLPLSRALLNGGIRAIEITFSTPNAPSAIRKVFETFGHEVIVGAGTVIKPQQCKDALDAGAHFIVTPIMKTELIDPVHAAGRPIMVGAYSPSEAQAAFEAGADMVKIFPADGLGPDYIRAIKAPLPHLPTVPTGGVNLETMEAFLKAGCIALGVGSSLLTRSIMERDDWSALTNLARQYTERLQSIRQTLKIKN
ncbi:MAG: bifunctional 4-hydroxy-2-oxoglutarate aldolase/2-dehydro-3-deoxy-phosphogluconate aldolase [Verrucomicrobiota bacterium]|jgi:2-dehydro-3-deoxyphosphogluconate aldolase / (4S)-4-hydroxy-2-oxoglutarate aldolase|nr:bifunctional 4-hydroxy-2-oxoglutarate aldolase/2-dehydro-3-deoxy-phosphogluconate aldolase [Verrucomicrobiota bacterium]MDG1892421.1 bifunctional 4-hydroxy-2-oxoglutarate aldolase/2-dehydro-3-deoxy-phosphogluconate aldolase [Verrucomicrobiota bacterium]